MTPPTTTVDTRPARRLDDAIATASGLHQLFERQALRTPDLPAVVFEHETLSYRELDRRADTLARALRSEGVGSEVIVALFVERSLEMIIGLLAILKAGGAYLPIDGSSPPERVAFMLEDAAVRLVLTHTAWQSPAPDGPRVLCLDTFDWTRSDRPAPHRAAVHPAQLAYVIYTSGSTGRPKGVCIEHRNIMAYTLAVAERLQLSKGLTFATVSTVAADLGHTVVFPSLTTGGCLHVISQACADSPAALEAYFRREQIDVLKITPSHLAALHLGRHPEHVMPRRSLILGGEPSRLDWIARVRALAPGCEIFNHYGPTEATVGALMYRVPPVLPQTASGTLPLGTSLPHARVYVLDPHGRQAEPGVLGELWIGGRGVGRGYLNRPDETAARFVPDPFRLDPAGMSYRTGDLARRLPDGTLEFCGRVDDQVKIRGYRVEPGEIQAVLCGHPGVRDAHVLVVDDGKAGRQLVAYVVPASRAPQRDEAEAATPATLRAHLRSQLPSHMIPSAIVMLEAFPLTVNGKLDRQALPASPVAPAGAPGPSAGLTATESRLAGIWTNVLGVDHAGAGDNFFEVGGHSLLAFRLMARIREAFEIDVPLRVLFEHPTLGGLAAMIDGLGVLAAPGPAAGLDHAAVEVTL